MKSIGVRELRLHAGRYLRDVQRGAQIEVTDHGRAVALLVPLRRSSPADALLQSGQLSPAHGDLFKLGAPLQPRRSVPLPSAELAKIRRDER